MGESKQPEIKLDKQVIKKLDSGLRRLIRMSDKDIVKQVSRANERLEKQRLHLKDTGKRLSKGTRTGAVTAGKSPCAENRYARSDICYRACRQVAADPRIGTCHHPLHRQP